MSNHHCPPPGRRGQGPARVTHTERMQIPPTRPQGDATYACSLQLPSVPHTPGGAYSHSDQKAASGPHPCLRFGASSKTSHVLPAAPWQLGPFCSWRPKQGVQRSPLKSPAWLTTLRSGLPPGNPTGVDQHLLELRKEQPSFQKPCSQAWPCWKPLHTVLGGWNPGFLQTDMGCGVQKGEAEDRRVPSPDPVLATSHTGRAEENLGEEG